MASAHASLRGSQSSSEPVSPESSTRALGPVDSWESELTSIQHSLKFVLKLKEEFVCPVCRGVVLNPQQNSCGHIYCFRCLQNLLGSSPPSSPVCPVDGAVIAPAEVFQDNCCKREISSLEVFCPNAPACPSVLALSHVQEHLRSCRHELLPCTSPGCTSLLERRHLHEHLSSTCPHRLEPSPHRLEPSPHRLEPSPHRLEPSPQSLEPSPHRLEPSPHCRRPQPGSLVQLTEHSSSCPEVHVHCSFRTVGCSVQDKRREVKLHEDAAFSQHMLLVMRSNASLEQQMELLQEEALLRRQEVHTESLVLAGLQEEIRPLLQQSSRHQHIVSAVQGTVDRHQDVLSTITLDLQQVSLGLGSGLEELEQLRKSVQAVIQEVSAVEALRKQLGTLQEKLKHQSGLLEQHAAQLSLSKQHLQELEATSYDGKMIWKIQDFSKRREAEASGQAPCLTSVPFHTGCCGYKLAAKAYLNGDGDGRGSHLSLYVVLMPGDFDALLPWPFRQTVCLSVLDQSGAGNHRSLSFRPDPASKSFQRPAADNNVAVGFSSFLPLHRLETQPSAAFVKDDTLFIKVKVDVSGLEQL